jgi:hypothetical protein
MIRSPRHWLFSMAVLVAASASHAQPGSGGTGKVAPQNGIAVSSFNRIDSATLAARTQARGRPTSGPGAATPGALVFVDSTGKVVGRAIGDEALLASWEGQPLTITGVNYLRRSCATPGACLGPGDGGAWGTDGWLGYVDLNCTGDPLVPARMPGVFTAHPFFDGGHFYLYISRPAQLRDLVIHSHYSGGQCSNLPGGSNMPAVPVTAVVPASTYGTPPFFLK